MADPRTDEELLAAVDGEPEAFAVFYGRHVRPLLGYLGDSLRDSLAVLSYRLGLLQRFKLVVVVAAELLFTLSQISVFGECAIRPQFHPLEGGSNSSVNSPSGSWASWSTSVREDIEFQPFGEFGNIGLAQRQSAATKPRGERKPCRQGRAHSGVGPWNRTTAPRPRK